MNRVLTEQELRQITQRQQRRAQGRVLREMGITYARRPDGSLVVAVDHFMRVMGCEPAARDQLEVTLNLGEGLQA